MRASWNALALLLLTIVPLPVLAVEGTEGEIVIGSFFGPGEAPNATGQPGFDVQAICPNSSSQQVNFFAHIWAEDIYGHWAYGEVECLGIIPGNSPHFLVDTSQTHSWTDSNFQVEFTVYAYVEAMICDTDECLLDWDYDWVSLY